MMQKELNQENREIKSKAYELYKQHGFKDGNAFVDWLEADWQMEKRSGSKRNTQMKNILLTIVGILSVVVVILLITLFEISPKMELSEKSLSELKVMVLVLGSKADEKAPVFGDTQFDFNKSRFRQEAKTLLDKDVQVLKGNPATEVRMAGYTSAQGTETSIKY